MRAVVVASGELAASDETWLDEADLVIAADGGAGSLDRLGRRPHLLVGDLDSTDAGLVERLAGTETRIDRHPVDKEASDTELAMRAATRADATEIVLIGATGGQRLDHELANLFLLADPSLAGRDVRLVHGSSTARVVNGGGELQLVGGVGDLATLLPLGGDALGVTTGGLRWALHGATLGMGGSRGLSNEVIENPASVRLEHGTLLVVETAVGGASA